LQHIATPKVKTPDAQNILRPSFGSLQLTILAKF